MSRLLSYREVILKALENLRATKSIGNSLQAMVQLTLPQNDRQMEARDIDLLTEMAMVAHIDVIFGLELACQASNTTWNKCERCWRYTVDVGTQSDYPDLCGRCYDVLKGNL